jgi:hypothetical protein
MKIRRRNSFLYRRKIRVAENIPMSERRAAKNGSIEHILKVNREQLLDREINAYGGVTGVRNVQYGNVGG